MFIVGQLEVKYWNKHTGKLLEAGCLSQLMSASTGKTFGEEEGYTRKLVTASATHTISGSNMDGRNQFHSTA